MKKYKSPKSEENIFDARVVQHDSAESLGLHMTAKGSAWIPL